MSQLRSKPIVGFDLSYEIVDRKKPIGFTIYNNKGNS